MRSGCIQDRKIRSGCIQDRKIRSDCMQDSWDAGQEDQVRLYARQLGCRTGRLWQVVCKAVYWSSKFLPQLTCSIYILYSRAGRRVTQAKFSFRYKRKKPITLCFQSATMYHIFAFSHVSINSHLVFDLVQNWRKPLFSMSPKR